MINVLEIPKVREYDNGTIRVVAKNPLGEAECSTTLVVIPHEDWRSRLKQAPKCKLKSDWTLSWKGHRGYKFFFTGLQSQVFADVCSSISDSCL